MFKSKLEVDRHVSNCLKKINNEKERSLRCFSFGKLYFSVGDYDQAYRYVTTYLSVKPKSAEGYLLLGKSLEKLGKLDAALEAYRNCLQIDPKQNNVVIKVCELMSTDNVELDLSGARYFCDLAQSFDPTNPAVYCLKEKLITKENEDPLKITELLLQELEIRPADINLRIRLLKHFIQNNMISEAYKHASAIEEKHTAVVYKNLSWYENFADILLRLQKEQSATSLNTWEFWLLSVSVLERLVALSLEEYHNNVKWSTEYITAIFNFDQILYKAHQNIHNLTMDRNLVSIFFKHYHAQLHFHISTLIFKQTKRDNMEFKEASNFVLPVLFTSYHCSPPDLNSMWLIQSSDSIKKLVYRWYQVACYRNSQVGHILVAAAKDRKSLLLEKATQYSSGMWRENLYKKLFVRRDHQLKLPSSFFVMNNLSVEPIIKLPYTDNLLNYDEVAQFVYPDSLHHYIWIALNSKISDINIKTFDGLQYSNINLLNCAAESLSILDIYAFICCATLCAKSHFKENKNKYFNLLPAAITENLATISQCKFLESSYKMYKNDDSNSSDVRVLLIKGIEVVRCVGHHGLDVKLLAILANIFEEHAKQLTQQLQIDSTLARAELYWKTAIPLLEKIKNNETITYFNNRMFEYKSTTLTLTEAQSFLEKGKLFIATQLYNKKDFEKSLIIFSELKDPYASFYQYEIYKTIAEQKKKENKFNEYKILLTKARDCLYLTLDRLREPSFDISHPLNSQLNTEIGKVERLLSAIESNRIDLNNSDEISEVNRSLDNSIGEQYLSIFKNQLTLNDSRLASRLESENSHSTPLRLNTVRQEARPSPERLDAQIRQILTTRDTSFSLVAEQNKTIVDAQNNLLQKLNCVIDDLKTIKVDIENLKEVTKSVNEIKNATEDFQNMMDVIKEIKKDLNEVKKNETKNNQLSDEDLYVLDPDYGVEYNLAANIPGTYPNYPAARIPNPSHIPAYAPSIMYPGLYPGLTYPYGGLNFPQPGALSFLQDQQGATIPTTLPSNLVPAPNNTKFSIDTRKNQTITQPNQLAKEETTISSSNVNQIKFPTTSSPLVPAFGKSPPVNVVITTSDPLPSKSVLISQPILSVTIPPQHVKSNFSKHSVISTPSGSSLFTTTTPKALPSTPQAVLSVTEPKRNVDKIEDVSSTSINSLEDEPNVEFKPVIPLPDEVPVVTGEENENELFCARAKLFRHVNINGTKEWKERGVGTLKILNNQVSGKSRILMRRDQVLKLCANHFIQKDMTLVQGLNNEKAFTWIAQDFSEGELQLETFCVRFKTVEEAKKFSDVFKSVKEAYQNVGELKIKSTIIDDKPKMKENLFQSNSLGGFVFSGTPTFKPKEITQIAVPEKPQETTISSPFSAFVFGKDGSKKEEETKKFSPLVISQGKNTEESDFSPVDEFVPTAEFKPVIPLPELVEIKTGEENAQVLFEARTKLFRFDSDSKEWKERGVGTIKILKDDSLRLLMRRDQVHKVCCNHRILKDMIFKPNSSNPKAIYWQAQDFSEGELVSETFSARFKTEEIAKQFLQTLQNMQESLDENNSFKEAKPSESFPKKISTETKKNVSSGFGDTFKIKPGAWECKTCLIRNEGNIDSCLACDTPKDGTLKQNILKPVSNFTFSFGTNNKQSNVGFGDAFKIKPGSWECKTCLIRNDGDVQVCMACNTTREGTIKQNSAIPSNNFTFSFGTNVKPSSEVKPDIGFGDSFKIKPGSWECKTCFVRNEGTVQNCVACKTTKEGTLNQADKTVNVSENTWSFGIPATTPTSKIINQEIPSKIPEASKPLFSNPTSFFFGSNQKDTGKTNIITQGNQESDEKNTSIIDTKWSFGSSNSTITSEENKQTPEKTSFDFGKNSGSFIFGSNQKEGFEFKQRTPRRISGGPGNEESDGSYVEEEEDTIYFKPIIPLPDKVQVKTGEEEEDVLFCQRAKLFRFVNGEWKERGLGDVKILRNRLTKKLRVVMRREQIFKICLNHLLTKEIEYLHKDEKSLLFAAADFSEGEIVHEQFCLRFKNGDFANDFKTAAKNALGGFIEKPINNTRSSTTTTEDEVIFVNETQVTPEEEKIALSLGLPPKFLSYKQLPDCVCEQCKKDDEYLKDLFANETNSTKTGFTFSPSTSTSTGLGSFSLKPSVLAPSVVIPKPIIDSTTKFISPLSNVSGSNSTASSVSSNTSIFGSKNFSFSAFSNNSNSSINTGNIFSSLAANNFDQSSKPTFVFESKPLTSIFGGSNTTTQNTPVSQSVFGNSKSSTQTSTLKNPFASAQVTSSETNNSSSKLPEAEELVLKCDSNLSFASLAAATTEEMKPAFVKKNDESFAFLGAGAPVFKSHKPQSAAGDTSKNENEDEEENHNDEYDPHYEPIVPLPEQVVVTTGEENENVLFNERSKLFRYDTNTREWKERGVGQLKILQHRDQNTYRLLMRREQVYKVVLNQLINPNFELQPMVTSDKAWMWAGYNYTDDENCLEKLAVRFKNVELANQFRDVIVDVVGKLQISTRQQEAVPISVQQFENETESGEDEEDESYFKDDNDGNNYDDYGEEEEDDDERTVMFMKECTLSELQSDNQWSPVGAGDLQVYYDPDLYAARIQVTDNEGTILSNTLIGVNTLMDLDKNECTWKATEWATNDVQWRNLKASFESDVAAQEFHSNYIESLNYAQQVGLVDEIPTECEPEN